ncbi:MAG: toll/interleukin-1 receptor domain-containing protein [Rubrivivax sp.]|nr:toll/interleukin-1 receptor domain-containing protein [Rubrivivax sp.]
MPQVQIFISYRRDDSSGYARALATDLARHWGEEKVFIDVDDIGDGQPFADVISQAVGRSEVLLVLIGPRWMGLREGQPPRLHDSDDFVRREVATALDRGMQVIPVLLDGARMPADSDLPTPLQALAGRHALELRHSHYAADLERLLSALRQTLGDGPLSTPLSTPLPAPPRRAGWWLLAAAAVLLPTGWWLLQAGAPVRPDINGRWQAEVEYDWPNSRYTEQFQFRGEGALLQGTATFLRAPREVLQGRAEGDVLDFITHSIEVSSGEAQRQKTQRYRARLVANELHVDLQIEGGSPPHAPISFVARRLPAAVPR